MNMQIRCLGIRKSGKQIPLYLCWFWLVDVSTRILEVIMVAIDFVQVAATQISLSLWIIQYTTRGLQLYQANLYSTYKRKKILILISCYCYLSNSNTKYTRQITWLQCRPQRFCLRFPYTRLKKKKGQKSLADVNIPVPLPSLIPFFGNDFSILVTVAILGFMTAALFVALIVVLLPIRVPGTVPGLSVSVVTASMGLVSVIVVTMWGGIVVCVFMGIIFLWLYVGRVSALLGFWIKCLLPGEASAGAAAVVVVWGWGGRPMLGFLHWFQARFFSLGSRTGRSRTICPLLTLRTLAAKGTYTLIQILVSKKAILGPLPNSSDVLWHWFGLHSEVPKTVHTVTFFMIQVAFFHMFFCGLNTNANISDWR